MNTMVVKKQKFGEIINMNISQEGLSLIKKFEGCELEAYKCAAGVLTIGYGSTKGVKEGDTVCVTQLGGNGLKIHGRRLEALEHPGGFF